MIKFKDKFNSVFSDKLIELLHNESLNLIPDNDSTDLLITLYNVGKDNELNSFYDTVSDIVSGDNQIQEYIAGYLVKRFKNRWKTVSDSLASNQSLFITAIVSDSLNQTVDQDTVTNMDYYPVDDNNVITGDKAQDKENTLNTDSTLNQTRTTQKTSIQDYNKRLNNYLAYSNNFIIDLICNDIVQFITVSVY
jgi:hypothetical protein